MRACQLRIGAALEKMCSLLGLAWTPVITDEKVADVFVGSESSVSDMEAADQYVAGRIHSYRKEMQRVLARRESR
jgi:hypothetical protein